VSGSGITWAICKPAPRSRQITTPTPHHSVFYRLDALPATQPTPSKHLLMMQILVAWGKSTETRNSRPLQTKHVTPCITPIVLYTKMDTTRDKLAMTFKLTTLAVQSKCCGSTSLITWFRTSFQRIKCPLEIPMR